MFTNIGKKLQTLAIVFCWLGIAASIIRAIVLWSENGRWNPTVALGCGVLIGGCLASWLSSLFLYAFGQLVDDIHAMSMGNSTSSHQPLPSVDNSQEAIYQKGLQSASSGIYSLAAHYFSLIPGYKDADEKKAECERLAE